MNLMDYFIKIPEITSEEFKEIVNNPPPDGYQLLDVRQEEEFKLEHIPGAYLIPLGELNARIDELEKSKLILVYCASGNRSRAAASVLMNGGFENVFSVTGGIQRWKGLKAASLPEAVMVLFPPVASIRDRITISLILEEGNRMFYESLAKNLPFSGKENVFIELSRAEKSHQEHLLRFTRENRIPLEDHKKTGHSSMLNLNEISTVIESGMDLYNAINWFMNRPVKEVLEYAMGMEAQLYDLYLRLGKMNDAAESRSFFEFMASEEKDHLNYLTKIMEADYT